MRRPGTLLLLLLAAQLHAATEYPPRLKWQTITTEHFHVHFHQGEEALASRAAGYAEDAHKQLVPLLDWTPRGRTHLVLSDHVDVSNGSATPFPNNRMEVYVTSPGADPTSSINYHDDWLKLVILHEYTHILHLDQARGVSKSIRTVFGRMPLLGFPQEFSPLWMIEGLATLAESETTGAGRLKGTYLNMVLRTAAVENRFGSESEASGLGPYWPSGSSRYLYGAKFLSWLSRTHGADKLTQYLGDYSSNLIPFRVNASAKAVYGKSMKSLWQEWSAVQQQSYKVERDRLALDGLSERKRLTTFGYETTHPLLSPDGTRIAYSHRGPYERPTLRIRDVASGRDTRVRTVNTNSTVSWSADGKFIAYSDLEFTGTFSLLSDLYIWDVERNDTRRVTSASRLKDPAFTPDGKTLIAVANSLGRNRLVEVDVASGAVRELATPDNDRQFGEPVVSHDGRLIAVAEWMNGSTHVVTFDRTGRRVANVTERHTAATNASPRFSPDDREIWFSSDVTGVTNLYSVLAGGGEIRRLTNVYGGAFYPTSSDGRRFFYSDYSSEGFDLAVVDKGRDYPTVARVVPTTVMGSNRVASNIPNALIEPAAPVQPKPYSPWRSLLPRWWVPVIESTRVNGENRAEIGFTTSGADALFRHVYDLTITNRSYGVLYSYDRLYPTLTFVAARYDDDVARFVNGDSTTTYTESTNHFLAQASVPWRKVGWQMEATAGVIRDSITSNSSDVISQDDLDRTGIFTGTLQGVRVGAFFNNAKQFPFSISAERGVTASVQYEHLSRAFGSDRSLQQLRGDVRGYLTIPYNRTPLGRHVVALRGAGGDNSGDFILQRELRVGGLGYGERATLDSRSFPVRGYESGTLRGERAAITSLEYRFPLYEIERGPTTLPVFFSRIHGDVFVDGGRIWQQRAERSEFDTIASMGGELSTDFILGNFVPVRLRAGLAYLLLDPGKGDVQPYITLGGSF
ncbi:MAG TPA: hypothetical protein VNM92_04185 [Thermoanaerobaculia bacterium]|nr:hypothetical protein [Thermoanaerobaculia bacterium]